MDALQEQTQALGGRARGKRHRQHTRTLSRDTHAAARVQDFLLRLSEAADSALETSLNEDVYSIYNSLVPSLHLDAMGREDAGVARCVVLASVFWRPLYAEWFHTGGGMRACLDACQCIWFGFGLQAALDSNL